VLFHDDPSGFPAVLLLVEPPTGLRVVEDAGAYVPAAQDYISHLQTSLSYSLRPGNRQQLAAVLADASALAGWQAIDVGQPGVAETVGEQGHAASVLYGLKLNCVARQQCLEAPLPGCVVSARSLEPGRKLLRELAIGCSDVSERASREVGGDGGCTAEDVGHVLRSPLADDVRAQRGEEGFRQVGEGQADFQVDGMHHHLSAAHAGYLGRWHGAALGRDHL
jgi:hypothetical protein